MKYLIGFILGIAVGQIGFSGVAKVLDRGVTTVQKYAEETAK